MTTAKTLLTANEFLAMPDDGKNYELVKGELVEMPPPGFIHEFIVAQFIYKLQLLCAAAQSGHRHRRSRHLH